MRLYKKAAQRVLIFFFLSMMERDKEPERLRYGASYGEVLLDRKRMIDPRGSEDPCV